MPFMRYLSIFMLLILPLSSWALEPDAQAAKEEGLRLWGIHRWIDMQPHLERAAEAGDVEAMYYLGEANRRLDRGYSHKAVGWYVQAADRGDPYAMLRLYQGMVCKLGDREEWCPEEGEDWDEALIAQELPKAQAGDSEAMLVLHYLHYINSNSGQAKSWLEKAAEAGNPEAQNLLGEKIRWEDLGWYWTEAGRLEAAGEWFQKAAELNYAPAMANLAPVARELGHGDEAWNWVVKASEIGHKSSRINVGWCYLNPEERGDMCGVEQNVIKGWAILSAVVKEISDKTSQDIMDDNRDLLIREEREQAGALAREWLNRETPLSNYLERYDPDI